MSVKNRICGENFQEAGLDDESEYVLTRSIHSHESVKMHNNWGSCIICNTKPKGSWNKWLGRLQTYKEQQGHCNVPNNDSELQRLSQWISRARGQKKKGLLSEEKIKKLNELGFIWGFQQQKADETWMKWYQELEKYTQANGNPHVPRTHTNTKLASWVWIQRIRRKRGYQSVKKLTSIQIELLDRLGFYWDGQKDKWLKQLTKLEAFKIKFGHCNVEFQKRDYKDLLAWLIKQRVHKKEKRLQPERIKLLDELGIEWKAGALREVKWREKYEKLKQYNIENGNSDVPYAYPNDSQLAAWVSNQRVQYKKNLLTNEQINLLNQINFTWNHRDRWKHRDRNLWEDRFAEVIAFREKHGHCNIPIYLIEPPKLGAFVNATRFQFSKGLLSAERIAKLNSVGFIWKSKKYKN